MLVRETRWSLASSPRLSPAVTIPKNRLAIDVERLAADMPAFEFGTAHPGADAFDDQDRSSSAIAPMITTMARPSASAGIDIFAERDELDAEVTQFIEDFQIVSNRAGDAIARPDDNDIELAAASVGQELIEPGRAWLWRR